MSLPRRKALQLPKDGNGVAGDGDDAGLVHDLLVEGVHRVQVARQLVCRYVETHLHKRYRCVIVL